MGDRLKKENPHIAKMWVACWNDWMSRISIDVTEEEHKRLKALAALKGVTLKDYLLKSALDAPEEDEEAALEKLEAFLQARVRRSEEEGVSSRSVDEIFDAERRKKGVTPQHG